VWTLDRLTLRSLPTLIAYIERFMNWALVSVLCRRTSTPTADWEVRTPLPALGPARTGTGFERIRSSRPITALAQGAFLGGGHRTGLKTVQYGETAS